MSVPTNIADAIAGMRDGTIGSQEVMIGDLIVSSLSGLRITTIKEVTRRPVQAGYSVDIGVIDTPTEIEMDIVLANPDYSPEGFVTAGLTGELEQLTETWVEKRDLLYATMELKEIVDITTHDQGFQSFVIESIEPQYDADEDWEGWIGTVRLVSFGNPTGSATAVDLSSAKTAADAYIGSF